MRLLICHGDSVAEIVHSQVKGRMRTKPLPTLGTVQLALLGYNSVNHNLSHTWLPKAVECILREAKRRGCKHVAVGWIPLTEVSQMESRKLRKLTQYLRKSLKGKIAGKVISIEISNRQAVILESRTGIKRPLHIQIG